MWNYDNLIAHVQAAIQSRGGRIVRYDAAGDLDREDLIEAMHLLGWDHVGGRPTVDFSYITSFRPRDGGELVTGEAHSSQRSLYEAIVTALEGASVHE
ncbi:MAG: hypothetical protein H0W72_12445 [Planctomycetes bacterium]|nr:hypothetical protein [Planctomycetota bacterium]